MKTLPCKGCHGLCCGPVPVTLQELRNITKEIRSMPPKVRFELENQPRHFGTCIFYDLEQDKCGIHLVKPSICRAFGHYKNLACFRQPEAAAKEDWNTLELPAGLLTIDFTWKDF